MQFIEISSGGMEEFSLNLPTGFVYQSHNTTGSTCSNFSILNASNGNYHFSFNGSNGCIAKTEFTYRITTQSAKGTSNIFLLTRNGMLWNTITNISVDITSSNSITRAATIDINGNGYIDAYLLSFSNTSSITSGSLT
jgi:uncharacterized protein YegP (UPF0339 family)